MGLKPKGVGFMTMIDSAPLKFLGFSHRRSKTLVLGNMT